MMSLIILALLSGLVASTSFPESLKHDYKMSLKYPFNGTAIGFKVGGDVTFSDRFVRLAPSIPNKSGSLFSERTFSYDNAIIDVKFSVSGRGFVGGNGFAIWFTDDLKEGRHNSYFGRNDDFKGFGVVLSTSDKNSGRKDPYIFGVQNDGSKKASDFSNYITASSTILGGCFHNFRNTPDKVHVRIMLMAHKLSVFTDTLHHGKGFASCFESNLNLGTLSINGQHLGISADTSNLADDHDLFSVDVYQINPPQKTKLDHQKKPLTSDEKKKIEHIQHIVEEVEKEKNTDETFGGAITHETVQHILENQFHMMEQMEHLAGLYKDSSSKSETLQSSSANQNSQSLEQKLDSISSRLDKLAEKFEKFSHSIGNSALSLKADLGDVHDRISEAHKKIEQVHSSTSHHFGKTLSDINSLWHWIKYTASIVGAAILVYGLLALIRKREQPKRFI